MPVSRRSSAPFRAALALGAALAAAPAGPVPARAESLLLTWTAPGDDGSVGRATTYELRFSESPIAGADTAGWWEGVARRVDGLPAPLSAGSREAYVVADLSPSTTYYFVLRTADEVPNVSGFSNLSVRTTTGGGSSLPTAGSFAARAAPGGVDLSWQPVVGGTALGYRLYRRTLPDTSRTVLAALALTEAAWRDTTVAGGATYEYFLATFDGAGEGIPALATISVPGDLLLSTTTALHGYPNPARGHATIRFDVAAPSGGHVRVTVFDLTGRRICTLFDGPLPAGPQAIEWGCRSDGGNTVAPGVYNVILETPGSRSSTQLAILP